MIKEKREKTQDRPPHDRIEQVELVLNHADPEEGYRLAPQLKHFCFTCRFFAHQENKRSVQPRAPESQLTDREETAAEAKEQEPDVAAGATQRFDGEVKSELRCTRGRGFPGWALQ
jgi:hypothetical protein